MLFCYCLCCYKFTILAIFCNTCNKSRQFVIICVFIYITMFTFTFITSVSISLLSLCEWLDITLKGPCQVGCFWVVPIRPLDCHPVCTQRSPCETKVPHVDLLSGFAHLLKALWGFWLVNGDQTQKTISDCKVVAG